MAENRLLYLSQADVVAAGLSMAEIIDALEAAFRAKGEGRTEMPPKPGVHPGGGNNFIHAMPAYIEDLKSAGVKWVSGYPENHKRGLPYITGLLIYNDVATGLPLAVMDCVWITAKRTGAASAIAARRLARPESSVMGMLGCGVQGRSHAEAFKVLFPIKKIMAYDQDPAGAARYAQEIGQSLGVEVVPVKTPREAVRGCDIVVTAGPILKVPHATIQAGWLGEGALARGLRLLLEPGRPGPGRQVLHGRRAAAQALPKHGLFSKHPADPRRPGRVGHRPEEGPRKRRGTHHDREPRAGHRRHGRGAPAVSARQGPGHRHLAAPMNQAAPGRPDS